MRTDQTGAREAGRRTQINVSPHAGEVDFSVLDRHGGGAALLDPISIADLLRNGFVYPPHTIFRDVKVASTGFDPAQDLHGTPVFHFARQSAAAPPRPPAGAVDDDELLDTYHRLLCDAVLRSTAAMRSPWLLQSGGKDSTSMAIAVAEVAPQTRCITYLGGKEEDETDSARFVARKLGLRHESLVCDPGRSYDRYLACLPGMPLLTADFAMLSYVDLAAEIAADGGDGILDALGSDPYFGVPPHWQTRVLTSLARGLRLPRGVLDLSLVSNSFGLCYVLGTMQMDGFERFYPGSRFIDAEVDELLGSDVARLSRWRLEVFRGDITTAKSMEAKRRVSATILESAVFAKGMYAAKALDLRLAYPYCDASLCDWVFREVPDDRLIGPGGVNKVLVRQHIARRFHELPYVSAKGSFRFDVRGLARQRFDQVHDFAVQMKQLMPGAAAWLERHRHRMNNKYFASKFYLLAVILPWLQSHAHESYPTQADEGSSP
ncbi:asparagine synthase-related protein [Rhodanobacter umsongensis]|uniref:Asparagine synthase-related protein n=1 Tax=Rhodanobacter umsongensis TaxID=633153 RepID=A0ABW0JK03_9GAMM